MAFGDININRYTIIKFLELVLTVTCVALHADSWNIQTDLGMLVTGTFVGYLILFAGAAAGYVMNTPTHKRIDIFYSVVGAALFIASGALLIDRFHNSSSWNSQSDYIKKNLAKGSLALINGLVLFIDAFLTHRGG